MARSFKDIITLRKHDPPLLEVCEPSIKGGAAAKHHVYKIRGSDHLGMLEIFRRFSNFYELREILFSRFLGLYVPPIPEKKKMVINWLKHTVILIKIITIGKQRQRFRRRTLCVPGQIHKGNMFVAIFIRITGIPDFLKTKW